MIYGEGKDIKKDENKALTLLKEAAKNGHKHALFQLAHRPEISNNFFMYAEHLVKAAKTNHIVAQAMILQIIPDPILRKIGLSEAEQKTLEEKFWKQNDEEVLMLLSEKDKILVLDAYYNNEKFTKNQRKKLLNLLFMLSEQNSSEAMLRLGTLYMRGELVKKNAKKAKEHWLKGAALDSPECLCGLGYFYEEDMENSGKRDYEKAFYYHQKAAEAGSANSHNQLGIMYKNGKGIEKNIKKAIYHFNQAMRLDDPKNKSAQVTSLIFHIPAFPHAAYNLGWLYLNELEENEKVFSWAITCFLTAAEHGHPEAKKTLEILGIERKPKTPHYQNSSFANFWKLEKPEVQNASMSPQECLLKFTQKMGLEVIWKFPTADKAWCYIPEDKIETVKQYDIHPLTLRKTTEDKYILLTEQLSKQNLNELTPTLKQNTTPKNNPSG